MENKIANMLAHIKKMKTASEMSLSDLSTRENLTINELNIVGFLLINPMYNTAKEIEELRLIKKSNISTSIEQLIKKGYLIRQNDEKDRRIIRLILTEKGTLLGEEVTKRQIGLFEQLFAGLSFEEIEIYFSINKKIASNIEKLH